MATREENLKKINFELEKLTDEELDEVVGGNAAETSNDSRFLNTLNGSTDRYGAERIAWSFGLHNKEIREAWAKVGIEATLDWVSGGFGKQNKYKRMDTGEELTQEQARQYAMDFTGHHLYESDWLYDW